MVRPGASRRRCGAGSSGLGRSARCACGVVLLLWCAGCAYIVKQTLAQVPGVRAVDVSYRARTAVITFDDEEATVAALTEATARIGLPSAVMR